MKLRGGERILVRIPSWLGDAVMAEPVLRALGQWSADTEHAGSLSLAGPAAILDLFEPALPGTRLIPIAASGHAVPADWRGHDVALLLTGSFRSAWTAMRAGISERVGWARDGRGWLLTTSAQPARECGRTPVGLGTHGRLPRWLPRPFGAGCVELLGLLGLQVRSTRPRLEVTERAREQVRDRLSRLGLDLAEPFYLLNAGGRAGSAKSVSAATWVATMGVLLGTLELPVVVVAGPGEEQRALECASSIAGAVSLVQPTVDLAELAALCESTALVLTGDGGPRHVAIACGADLVCAMGPTDPRHSADFLGRSRVVRQVVLCGPCHRERCPRTGSEKDICLSGLDPDLMAAAALDLLRSSPPTD